jgi:predicted enzyme related to lactoylglutathione lyase
VTHFSTIAVIVIDVPAGGHEQEVAFWQTATGQPLQHYQKFPEYHGAQLPGKDLGFLVQRLHDGPARVHLDIHTDNLDAEVARLEQAGAVRVQQVNGWWIMQDPAGLPFCVIPEEPGTYTEENAQRWD